MSADTSLLPSLRCQADRLVELGVHRIAGLSAAELRDAATALDTPGALLAVHPGSAPASHLAPLLRHNGVPGFVVADMTDVDSFIPIATSAPPDSPIYAVHGVDRGDEMANWSPVEALEAITRNARTALLLTEGMHWVLQNPEVLERGKCFMTIGSRLPKPNGALDARTPALWISNGTGRDGRANRDAPKVGWCWARNRHTWLGFASAERRVS